MIVRWRRVDVRSEKCQIIYPLKMSAFRVVIDRTHDPRVARSSQPWALLRNPFGILFSNLCRVPGVMRNFFGSAQIRQISGLTLDVGLWTLDSVKVLVCPDKFKGTLTAHEAAQAV